MTARRTCPNCGKRRAISRFGNRSPRKNQENWCDPCIQRKNACYNMRNRYGITIEDYEAMVEAQGERCACCGDELGDTPGRGERFHIDHCHATGKVRGLLCHRCNVALGQINDEPERALSLARYLREAA